MLFLLVIIMKKEIQKEVLFVTIPMTYSLKDIMERSGEDLVASKILIKILILSQKLHQMLMKISYISIMEIAIHYN